MTVAAMTLFAFALIAPPKFNLARPTLMLPAVFSDGMVLQREKAVPVFGRAKPGSWIIVQIAGQKHLTITKPDGAWSVKLKPLRAGGPHTLQVHGDRTLNVRNVLVGEVWLCSGQSNMEWPVSLTDDAAKTIATADRGIRMFTVHKASTENPADNVEGAWVPATSRTVPYFSAVAYAFGRELRQKLKVPIGLVHASWGGTPAESWTSRHALVTEPSLRVLVRRYLSSLSDYPKRKKEYERAFAEWRQKAFQEDNGNEGYHRGYALFDHDTKDWTPVPVPSQGEQSMWSDMDGAVWYRRTVEIPDSWQGKELRLDLGTIDDYDDAYVNGWRVGFTHDGTPDSWWFSRSYRVGSGIVRKGKNVIAVRVFDTAGGGGFTGMPSQMRLRPVGLPNAEPISLSGEWLRMVEERLDPSNAAQPQPPLGPGSAWAVGGLYNGMLAPIVGYGIKGAIWYQGESNAGRAAQYQRLFPAMIRDWRKRWGQGDFPFHFVQLANFMERKTEPTESAWAELREAQRMALRLPNTGMAVAIDIGASNDIHPRNKREVGRRLALSAMAKVYGLAVPHTGPLLSEARPEGNAVRLTFKNIWGTLTTADGRAPVGFTIAGPDHKFHPAEARIERHMIIVSSPDVPSPVAVRYAWADNPECNLTDRSGLPASPFRTDEWPGVTANNE